MIERDLSLTFAAGGNKSFYQFGLMKHWRGQLLPRVRVIAACSAGACVAALLLSGREREVEEFWKRNGSVTRNFQWRRLLSARRPTPHGELYRELLMHAFASGGFERVCAQPFPVLVLTTAFPRRMPALAAALMGFCAYNLDQRTKANGRPSLSRRVGFRPLVFDARRCASPDELADLIIATSATPPFTPVGRFRAQRLLDGGIIDPSPDFLADEVPGVNRSLILQTSPRPHSAVADNDRPRLLIAPRTTLPIGTWDFTRPDLLQATIETGERDAELYRQQLNDFIGRET
jgi:predicted acylesterase/phospholipase RssA